MLGETLEKSEASENATIADRENSDPVKINVEEPKADDQFVNEVERIVDDAENEETNNKEEGKGVIKDGNIVVDTRVTAMAVDFMAALYPNPSEDDDAWEDDEENSEDDDDDNEEPDVDEEELSEEEVMKENEGNSEKNVEETAVEEDETNEEEAIRGGDGEEHAEEEKEIAKEDDGEAAKPNTEKVEVNSKKVKKSSGKKSNSVREESLGKLIVGNKANSSVKSKVKNRVEGMGMIFMCSSKTKDDCFQYRILGLPQSKKDMVEKIYPGMRLFLYDIDLKLMYGIFKAKGSGGYNIEPKAFKSQFPAQVRFTILDDCLPLPEEKFKKVIKDNYFTKKKFDGQLNSEQVKNLCKLFLSISKHHRPKKLGRNTVAATQPMSRRAEKQSVHRDTQRLEKQPIRQDTRKAEKQPICRDTRKTEKQPTRRDETRKMCLIDKRRPVLREEIRYVDRPTKRPRRVIVPVEPLRQPLPVPVYAVERNFAVDAYRRDLHLLGRRDPHRDGRDSHISRRDPYIVRCDRPTERDLHVEPRDPYRDAHDPYMVSRDPYSLGRDPYFDCRDPYTERRDPYPDRRDQLDSYVERRDPYKDDPVSETHSSYRRDPIQDRRDVYREDRGVAYRDSYRRGEVSDHQPLSLESTRCYDVASQDPYVSYRALLSNAEPLYSAAYPLQSGLARVFHL